MPGGGDSPLASRELQELWFATMRRAWKTLVVVPADTSVDAMSVALALGEFGGRHRGRPLRVSSTVGLDLTEVGNLVADVTVQDGSQGVQSIIAIEPASDNPLGIAAALAADAAILLIGLGSTPLHCARHAVEQIGAERFLGCVLISSSRR
jgi:hypothetical protein